MATLALVVFGLLIFTALAQAGMVYRVARVFAMREPAVPKGEPLPKVGVVLSLRGRDAYLVDCLRGLLNQDYPDYTVQIVVDSETDPAWQVVERVVRDCGATHVRISALKFPRPTCSLKCSSLIQAVAELDESHAVVAFIDADVTPHRTWLRELVAPLDDPGVGATTGNRWYMPGPGARLLGTASRCTWGAGALVQMFCFDIPWGGSMAMRMTTIRQANLAEKWAKSFNDDLLIGSLVREIGLTLKLVPSLMMVNREECTLGGFHSWCARQLLHIRFYHRQWTALAGFGVFMSLLFPLAAATIVAGALMSHAAVVAWSAAGMLGYFTIMTALYFWVEECVLRVVAARHEPTHRLGVRSFWAVPLTQFVQGLSLFSAMFTRKVQWRGVTYRINGPWDVELLEYRPYHAVANAVETASI